PKDRLPPLLVTLEAASRTTGLLTLTVPPPLRLVPRKVLAAAGAGRVELGSVARPSVLPALVLPSSRMASGFWPGTPEVPPVANRSLPVMLSLPAALTE